MMFGTFRALALTGLLAVANSTPSPESQHLSYGDGFSSRPTCIIPSHGNGTNDAPAILQAFNKCGKGGRVVFSNATYNIAQEMNTTDLNDVEIDIYGTLLWSDDIDYWLNNSIMIGYQNQSFAWYLGGDKLTVRGHGVGTLDGNGQAWYDFVKGESNYPHRPGNLAIYNCTNSHFSDLRLVQSQMWTIDIYGSENIILEDIYVNSTSSNSNAARNTDGADTMFSSNITFRRWTIDNGDDAIALKANSTNILVEDCVFYEGQGFALGSIGQYEGQFEKIENVTVRNVTYKETKYAAYVKTWTGEKVNYPPNGGGGGIGYIKNIELYDLDLNLRSSPFSISQCTSFSGSPGDCNTSLFHISNITLHDLVGSAGTSVVANMQCSSAAGGCNGIEIEDLEVKNGTGALLDRFLCSNVHETLGFNCTGNVTSNDGGS